MARATSAAAALPRDALLRIASPLCESIAAAPYEPPAGSSASVKALLANLLPSPSQPQLPAEKESENLLLFCAAMLAASPESPALHWVPAGLSAAAAAATEDMAASGGWDGVGEMVRAMMPDVVPSLKAVVKESCVDSDNDEIGAEKPPKEHAIVASHQFQWLVSQVNYPKLGKLCWLVIPCALTTLDHWSPEVKEQGMISFMHIARNVKVAELNLYEDAILDACFHNIAASTPLRPLLILLCPYLPPAFRRPLTMHPSSSSSSSGYHSRAAAFASSQPRGGGRGGGRPHGRGHGGRGGAGNDRIDALGRLLTKVLRHMAPELGLDMRTDGYVRVRDLLKLDLRTFANVPLKSHTVDEIREAVRVCNKQRCSLLEENGELWIRANQGHSVNTVTSENLLKPILSADEVSVCAHGTYRRNLDSILQYGLKRMTRLHIHFTSALPSDGEVISGIRNNVNVLIHLDVRKALQDGMKLYISDNKVILTEGFGGVVPLKYFEKIETWPGRMPIPFQR